jgi:hypothetical protein
MNKYIRQIIPGPNGTIHWADAQEVATVEGVSYVDNAATEQPPEVTLEPVTLTPELAETLVNNSHPLARTKALLDAYGPRFVEQLPALPDAQVYTGEYYRYGADMWMVIQPHDRAVFGGDPAQYPALIRKARNPYVIEAWTQPLDQFDAYKKEHPLTGEPERCLHNGQEWVVTGADGGGNNVWEPGVFGWSAVGGTEDGGGPPSNEWAPGVAYTAGQVVTYQGSSYECRQSHSSQLGWEPPNVLALWLPL